MRFASFGPLVRIFFFLSCFFFNSFLSTSNIGATVLRRAQRKLRRGERAQTTRIASFGPLVSVFFIFRVFLYILNYFYRFYVNMEVQMDTQEGTTRKTSPNDAIRVVWAISTCFLF